MGLITLQTHGHLGWRRTADFRFARKLTLQPLATDEIGRAAQWMPVAFRREQERWQAVAVFGPLQGANVYVGRDGRWRAGYVPAMLRVYPFELDADRAGLALNADYVAESRVKAEVEDFFDGPQLTRTLKQVERFLKSVEAGICGAHEALALLARKALLIPWAVSGSARVDVRAMPGELFQVDCAAFAALPDADILMLHRSGALRWLHAHIGSLHHVDRFRGLARTLGYPNLETPLRRDAIDDAADILSAIAADLGDAQPWAAQ